MKDNIWAEDLMNFLLWNAEKVINPSWRTWDRSFDDWVYRNTNRSQFHRLIQHQWVEREKKGPRYSYQLSAQGRIAAFGGVDPPTRWQRAWDGLWRMVVFDIEESRREQRLKLWRHLRQQRCGFLQKSVWIQPDPFLDSLQHTLGLQADVSGLIILEARSRPDFPDQQMVKKAWDFSKINTAYAEYISFANEWREKISRPGLSPKGRWSLLREERQAWTFTVFLDPFLPQSLLPVNYLGIQAWQSRQRLLSGFPT